MKAVEYVEYGAPEVLRCAEIEKPVPSHGQVLVRVHAASVNPLDAGELAGVPALARLIFGLRKPSPAVPGRLGVDLAGVVEATGGGVGRLKPGDGVFGICVDHPEASGAAVWLHRQGSFAEYVCVPEAALELKPANVQFAQAAAVPVAGLTALQGLRDKGGIRPGARVLIHGAGGGVGTLAVQIAKSFDAHVTAVTRSEHVEVLRRLGADRVIDYTSQDFTLDSARYDLLLDCHSSRPLSACRRVLNPKGVYVAVGGPGGAAMIRRLVGLLTAGLFSRRKFTTLLARPRQQDLAVLRRLMAEGRLVPLIDSDYGIGEVPAALRRLSEGRALGKVVISLVSEAEMARQQNGARQSDAADSGRNGPSPRPAQ